ncbi:MAG: DAK2 domain-containing protein [Candidatus Fimenecus sp.]
MLTGESLKNAFISGANNIQNHRKDVDALNVFPVPDGDTGTNMSMTIGAAVRELQVLGEADVATVSKKAAAALLRGARGNSGVILSLIFRGLSKGLKGLETADGVQFAAALDLGREAAYKAVMKPTEGTILTVVRLASAEAVAAKESDCKKVLEIVCNAAQDALLKTPEMLPVLKEAGVVDAGGQGFLYILEGMKSYLLDGVMIENQDEAALGAKSDAATEKPQVQFGYRCAFTVHKTKDAKATTPKLKAYLESVGGALSVTEDGDFIKVQICSDAPGNVLQSALDCGYLTDIQIENIREVKTAQPSAAEDTNAEQSAESDEAAQTDAPLTRVEPEKEYGFVAVAAGDGVTQLFQELGADIVVSGGQTMNPSTDDILHAVEATPARHVFVLPNNKNIIMAAEQTVNLADRGVSVLSTKTIPQGITAMLTFDPSVSPEENHLQMMKAAEGVHTAQVTFAARDSEMSGERIKKGQILGMEDGKITLVDNDLVDVAYRVTRRLVKKHNGSIITILYGAETEEAIANALCERLQGRFPNAEINVINGGQPVYYFIVSVE